MAGSLCQTKRMIKSESEKSHTETYEKVGEFPRLFSLLFIKRQKVCILNTAFLSGCFLIITMLTDDNDLDNS